MHAPSSKTEDVSFLYGNAHVSLLEQLGTYSSSIFSLRSCFVPLHSQSAFTDFDVIILAYVLS